MESLIHHFKLVTEGFRVPAGPGVRADRVTAGRARRARRVRRRHPAVSGAPARPSFVNLQSVPALTEGGMISDVIASVASVDPGDGWSGPLMLSERDARAARAEIIARYPKPRSALLPMLHLVQSDEGYVSPEGIALCAELLGLTKAEVGAVATFYTMYKRSRSATTTSASAPTRCARSWVATRSTRRCRSTSASTTQNGVTDDGKVSLEHVECNAACDFAPVVMVNWEFFDNQTPQSAVDAGRRAACAARRSTPTRGAASVCTWRAGGAGARRLLRRPRRRRCRRRPGHARGPQARPRAR